MLFDSNEILSEIAERFPKWNANMLHSNATIWKLLENMVKNSISPRTTFCKSTKSKVETSFASCYVTLVQTCGCKENICWFSSNRVKSRDRQSWIAHPDVVGYSKWYDSRCTLSICGALPYVCSRVAYWSTACDYVFTLSTRRYIVPYAHCSTNKYFMASRAAAIGIATMRYARINRINRINGTAESMKDTSQNHLAKWHIHTSTFLLLYASGWDVTFYYRWFNFEDTNRSFVPISQF